MNSERNGRILREYDVEFYFDEEKSKETRFTLNYSRKLSIFHLASVLNRCYNPSNPYNPSDFMYTDFKRILKLTNNKIVHIQRNFLFYSTI